VVGQAKISSTVCFAVSGSSTISLLGRYVGVSLFAAPARQSRLKLREVSYRGGRLTFMMMLTVVENGNAGRSEMLSLGPRGSGWHVTSPLHGIFH